MNPPGGRVGVCVAIDPPGVLVAVGGAGVWAGVGEETGFRYSPAAQPEPSPETEIGTQLWPPAAVDDPVTCTVIPLAMTPLLEEALLGPVRRLIRVVVRRFVPVG